VIRSETRPELPPKGFGRRIIVPAGKVRTHLLPASARASGLGDPLGRVLDRKKIGSFVFVNHHYPKLAGRASHSHPWLHLTMVRQGNYCRYCERGSYLQLATALLPK